MGESYFPTIPTYNLNELNGKILTISVQSDDEGTLVFGTDKETGKTYLLQHTEPAPAERKELADALNNRINNGQCIPQKEVKESEKLHGGTETLMITLPVGTKFYVHNGHWHGEIITLGGEKHILFQGAKPHEATPIELDQVLCITIEGSDT